MAASGTVASLCVGAVNPADTLRVRWQVAAASKAATVAAAAAPAAPASATAVPSTITSFASHILRSEGVWRGLWHPGLVANMAAVFASTGFRLGVYPNFRDAMGAALGADGKSAATMWLAGLLPGLVSYASITPLYNVKTHLQAAAPGPPPYRGTLHGLGVIARSEGVRGLFKGATSLAGRGGMVASGQTLGYDWTKTTAKAAGVTDGPVLHVAASVVSGMCATAFGMPCDVVFTRFSTARQRGVAYTNILHCARSVAQEGGGGLRGARAYYRGSVMFFVRAAPIFILYFPLYEQARRLLGMGYLS